MKWSFFVCLKQLNNASALYTVQISSIIHHCYSGLKFNYGMSQKKSLAKEARLTLWSHLRSSLGMQRASRYARALVCTANKDSGANLTVSRAHSTQANLFKARPETHDEKCTLCEFPKKVTSGEIFGPFHLLTTTLSLSFQKTSL